MPQTIIRTPKEVPYFIIARSAAQDKQLSYEALGLLTYLRSLPADWVIHPKALQRAGCGRDKVYRLLDELLRAGYIIRTEQRADNGRIAGVEYTVYDVPPGAPYPEKPDTAQPDPVNPDITYYTYVQNTHCTEKKDSSPEGDVGVEQEKSQTMPSRPVRSKADQPQSTTATGTTNSAARRALLDACSKAFACAPAHAAKILAFLEGALPEEDNRGRSNASWLEYMMQPSRPLTPALLRGFGIWWINKHPNVTRPSSPAAIANNWVRYLSDPDQARFEQDGALALALQHGDGAINNPAPALSVQTDNPYDGQDPETIFQSVLSQLKGLANGC